MGNEPFRIGPLQTDMNGLLRRGHILDRAAYLAVLLLFCGGLIRFVRRADAPDELFFVLVFDAYFCAYLLIEVGARYRYFILPFLLICGSRFLSSGTKGAPSSPLRKKEPRTGEDMLQ